MNRKSSVYSILLMVLFSFCLLPFDGWTACTPPPSDMVSWWKAEGNADDSRGFNNGTLTGNTTYAAGKVSQAFRFDGVDDYVALPDAASNLLNNSAGTIAAWVNPSAIGDNDIVVAFGSGNNGEGLGLGIFGMVRIYHHTGTYDWQSTTSVDANTWTLLTYTWDATTEKIYKNNVFSESRPRNFNYVPGHGRIGHGFWGDPANAFPGLIDEVAVFNRALSEQEISAIYTSGSDGICSPVCTPVAPGLIAWWKGEGNPGDAIGSHHGALMGDTGYTIGMVDQAFSFDGDGAYINVPSLSGANFPPSFTIGGWIKVPSLPTTEAVVAGMIGGYQLNLLPDGRVKFGYSGFMVNSTSSVPAGTFVYVVGTVDSSSNGVKIYINGVLDNQGSTTPGTNSNPFQIGGMEGYPGTFFLGAIDELEVYNRVLTAEEINGIYQAGSAGTCSICTPAPTGLVSWWRAEGDARDFWDGNHGTLQNGVAFAPGKVGQAFNLGGNDDYIQVSSPAGLPVGNSPRTMILWFKTPSNWGDSFQVLIQYGGNNSGEKFGLYVPDYWARTLSFWGESRDFQGSTPLQLNTWYHGAVTYDGSTVRLYLNGQFETSQTNSWNTQINSNGFIIGGAFPPDLITSQWNGLVDEAAIFNRVLSSQEIVAIYNAGSAGICAVKTIYLPLILRN